MPAIDARLVLARRYPVHAAVDRCNEVEVHRIVDDDAPFHLARKIPDKETSVVHMACMSRNVPAHIMENILRYLIKMGAPVHDLDAAGQTPLHYAACNRFGYRLTAALLEAGCNVQVARKMDQWTALHLAVTFGNMRVVQQLIRAGADPHASSLDEKTPLDLANQHKQAEICDILKSRREEYRPTSLEYPNPIFGEVLKRIQDSSNSGIPLSSTPIKLKDEQVNWADAQGNSALHLSAWKGDTTMTRIFFESIKGRKLVAVSNYQGATPLMMAILNFQEEVVEEFFMHKHAKKYLDLKVRLIDSQESTFHLLLKYCPQVPPKFILKRKDVDKDVVNAKDNLGTSALMKALWDKRSSTVEKILASKNIRENKLLDLEEVDKTGRSILHLLIDNNDLVNFQSLVDRDELTKEIANRPNPQGQTPISLCLKKKLVPFLEAIFDSSTGINKFHINVVQDGSSVIHVVATIGSLNLWLRALAKCDVNTIDELGNTALMKAAQCGHDYLVDSALQIAGDRINPEMRNKDGNTLLLMAIQNFDIDIVKALIQGRDHKRAINLANNESMSPLVLAASLNKWSLMRFLLESDHLKDEKGNGVVDVHLKDKAGQTPLVQVLLTRIKLHRMEQSFLMKGEKETAKDIRLEFDNLWEIVKLILEREKEVHGPTMMQGRDGGSETLKKQMNVNKTIQISIQQDVCREYAKLFTTIKPKKSLAKQISTGKLDQPNAAEDRKVSLKPVFRQNSLTSRDDIKSDDLQKGKEKKEVPTISLDDLRSPDGLQDVVNKITKKMDEEKSKIVKNKKKLGSIGKNGLPDSTTTPECKENENYLKVNSNAGENGSDASREWSPTPVPRMRRTSSFRKKPMHVEDMKPPIPSGPSPPPPPEPDNPNESKFKFPDPKPNATPKRNDVKSFVEDSKSLINIPMGLDSKDLKKSRSGNALNRKQTKSMVEPLANGREEESKTGVDLTVFQKKPATISTTSGVETREAFTQTDNLMEPKTLGVQACCCQCHETKPRPKSNEIGKNNNAFRRYSKL